LADAVISSTLQAFLSLLEKMEWLHVQRFHLAKVLTGVDG
jgi:hypothetical protein